MTTALLLYKILNLYPVYNFGGLQGACLRNTIRDTQREGRNDIRVQAMDNLGVMRAPDRNKQAVLRTQVLAAGCAYLAGRLK